MSNLSIEQAIAEMRDLVRCRCHPAYKDRGLHDPDCNCDDAEAVEVLANALTAVQPDAREAALREAAKVLANRADYLEDAVKWGGSKQYLASLKGGAIELRHARNSILALTNKPAVQLAHVNETPKSEHEAGNVLTPDNADPDDPDDPHILQAIIDSLLTDIADLTRQLQGQPRRPQDVTKGGA